MIGRALVVPAAGPGSRLRADRPKLLVPVARVPMIDRLLSLYSAFVHETILVVHPSFAADVVTHVAGRAMCIVQHVPTGMLDAILLAAAALQPDRVHEVWITWCDQVAVHPATVQRLADTTAKHPRAAVVMPTVERPEPYIHLQRDDVGRICRILHRREGDEMPPVGESDAGLFAISSNAFFDLLPMYARQVEIGQATRERNFLPFIPWMAARGDIVTFPCQDPIEAIGVNTPAELRIVEEYLTRRAS